MAEGLQSFIIFTSPEGKEFSARWSGNDESKDKNVGIFHSPGTVGERVQDQGIGSPRIPLNFFFDGEDLLTNSTAFFLACDEIGLWQVDHPEDGLRVLQLLTISVSKEPISSGGVRSFTSSWIEPNVEEDELSTAELKAGIESDVNDLNIAAATELEDTISQVQQSEITSFADSIGNAVDDIKAGTRAIFEDSGLAGVADTAIGLFESAQEEIRKTKAVIQSVQDDFNKIEKSITDAVDTVAEIALAPLTIGLQLQELAQTPARAIQNIQGRISAYSTTAGLMANRLLGISPTVAGKNNIQTTQIGMTAALCGSCLSVTTGELETRQQALDAANEIANLKALITGLLDDAAAGFSDNNIENQFFSQTETYNRISGIVAKAVKVLISESFDLKIEKRFILTEDKNICQVCVEEYGELGENDEVLDFLIKTNNLYEKEHLLLKAGFEVVVYR